MAEVKFSKGSEEWLMFMDYWNLCQKCWEVENSDKYWQDLIGAIDYFVDKYKSIPLAEQLGLALANTQSTKQKMLKEKENEDE